MIRSISAVHELWDELFQGLNKFLNLFYGLKIVWENIML